MPALSPRLQKILDALPLQPGLRVLEIGCGPGALARAIAMRVAPGQVLGIDRSARAVAQAMAASAEAIAAGHVSFRQVAAEDFVLAPGEAPFDLIVAVRVGAFDGRHPDARARAWPRLADAHAPGGCLVVDGLAYVLDAHLNAYVPV
ncbi:cyclopropane-fatty-acyl-phospholipid synthase family protein [Thauera sp. 2A1]|nr:class I SAM-dependent methyltransferase [Thauera sp. 2A1]KAI5912240.1 methyltransferase domain-containing protein [Thauera sp. 2A1]MBS0554502.1 methyltransferase domain-containing protein [Pseudomonadota bacterium]